MGLEYFSVLAILTFLMGLCIFTIKKILDSDGDKGTIYVTGIFFITLFMVLGFHFHKETLFLWVSQL